MLGPFFSFEAQMGKFWGWDAVQKLFLALSFGAMAQGLQIF